MGFALQGETHVVFISPGNLPADLLLVSAKPNSVLDKNILVIIRTKTSKNSLLRAANTTYRTQ